MDKQKVIALKTIEIILRLYYFNGNDGFQTRNKAVAIEKQYQRALTNRNEIYCPQS